MHQKQLSVSTEMFLKNCSFHTNGKTKKNQKTKQNDCYFKNVLNGSNIKWYFFHRSLLERQFAFIKVCTGIIVETLYKSFTYEGYF